MNATGETLEHPAILLLTSQMEVKGWSGEFLALGVPDAKFQAGRPVTDFLATLDSEMLLKRSGAQSSVEGLVAFARPEGVPLSLNMRRDATSDGFECRLTQNGRFQSLVEEQTATERLRAMLDWIPGFCYTVDTNLVFTSSRGAGLSNILLGQNQLVGMSLVDLWGTCDIGYEPLQCHLRAFAGMTQNYKDVCVGRSLDYEVSPLHDSDGRIIGAIGVGIDVTERETSRDEKARLVAQLRQAQKMESVGQLAGGIAHDFNNLLTCIIGNVALAQELAEPGSKTARMLEGAASAADSAATLTRQLLAYSRKQVIEPRPLNLSELIERVQTMLRRLIGEDVELKVDGSKDLWFVKADPGQLEQILVNLVVNARDAVDEGGEIVISTSNQVVNEGDSGVGQLSPGEYVRLSVSDNGRGMSDVVQQKLFEPFFTTKGLGEGTGLGLATVYGAAQQNGGEVTVESTLGNGAAFHIYLPRVEAPTAEASQVTVFPATEPRTKGGSETILLVEDEVSVLELSQRALENLGYQILACSSADEALRIFEDQKGRIDLLITDVVMPRMNGKELAARIFSHDPEVSVLFTSGYGENIIASNGVIEANLRFLPKPYRPSQLAGKVREILDTSPRSTAHKETGLPTD